MAFKCRLFAVLFAGGMFLMTATTPALADTDAQKLKVAKDMIHAWNTLDWPRVVDLFSEDGVLHSVMIEPVTGKAAIRERIMGLGAGITRIELKVQHIGVIDGRVFVERVDDFDYKGHAGAVPVVGVLEIENGHVKVWREYYDRAQLLHAMGVDSPAAAH